MAVAPGDIALSGSTHGLPTFLCHDSKITRALPVLDESKFDKKLLQVSALGISEGWQPRRGFRKEEGDSSVVAIRSTRQDARTERVAPNNRPDDVRERYTARRGPAPRLSQAR